MIAALTVALLVQAAPAEARHRVDTTLTVPARARLDLTNARGSVTIGRWARPELRIEARHLGPDSILIKRSRSVVTVLATSHHDTDRFEAGTDTSVVRIITKPRPFRQPTIVDYTITAPEGLAITLSGNAVDVAIVDISGPLDVATLTGTVRVTNARGSLTLQTMNGRIEVAGGSGRLFARALRGSAAIRDFAGDVDAQVLGGTLDLHGIVGDQVRGISLGGSITLAGPLSANGHYSLSTQRGTVAVTLDQDANATVDLAASGDPVLCEGITESPRPSTSWRRFTLGAGSALIEVDSFAGTVRLCRAAAKTP
ncbi:MAG: hypothetical protein HOP28_04475 [Gemmatimonadales bacterium]|nr:hypothetical protein [Gemmatimonadales bacterium]